jgi:hypothetical protein
MNIIAFSWWLVPIDLLLVVVSYINMRAYASWQRAVGRLEAATEALRHIEQIDQRLRQHALGVHNPPEDI